MHKRSYAILWAALAILLLGGLYLGVQALLQESEAGGSQPAANLLLISAPRPGEELPVFKVMQGDIFTLVIRSDRPGELDVHGYEKKIDVEPGSEVTLTFMVEHVGLFPLHLHEPLDPRQPNAPVSHRHLATLEVQGK